jgi:hypothetical protein
MHQPVMDAAERDREFVAHLAAEGARHVTKVMWKAWRVVRKSAANSAYEFEALMSTIRRTSTRVRGALALIRLRHLSRLDAANSAIAEIVGCEDSSDTRLKCGDQDLWPLGFNF